MTKLISGNQERSRAIKGDRTWSTGVMPEPPAMKPIVSKSFFSPEGVCVKVVSESVFTLPFACKTSVLKMYLLWEGGSVKGRRCEGKMWEAGSTHQRPSAAIAAISGHQRPSATNSSHLRQTAATSGQSGHVLAKRPSEVIRGHQRSSVVISGPQRSSEVIRGHQRPIWTRTGQTAP